MKHIKKLTALLLALVIGFSVCSVSFTSATEEMQEPQNLEDYAEILEDDGITVTEDGWVSNGQKAGRTARNEAYLNFIVDDIIQQVCDEVVQKSGFDVLLIAQSIPRTNHALDFVKTTFNIDTSALRDALNEKRYQFDRENNFLHAGICAYLGMYLSIIVECKAYCAPYEEWGENWYEVHLLISMKDGTTEDLGSGIMVNPVTGEVRGKGDDGMGGIGYNFSIHETLVYAPVHVWMRDFGFNIFYDLFCYTTPFFFYNTRRIKFDYAGKEWMIQIWKGNYLISNGAEIGIYNRDGIKFPTHYDCVNDDEMMNMSMRLYHGNDLLFERPEQAHWWITGFKLTETRYTADSMTLDFTIEMKDEEMLNAFCNAIEKNIYKDMTYTVDGLKVNVIW